MDKAKKTEIADNAIFETLKKLNDEYGIQFQSDSSYDTGRIVVIIRD